MILIKYGTCLKQLTEDKIELVRQWRNSDKIAQYMEYKEYITAEMQKDWYEKINNENNLFFLITFNDKEIGLINIKDIDYVSKTGEAGIFIFDDEYLGGLTAFQATLCLYDFFFVELNMDKLFAHVLRSNKRAKRFNEYIGFRLIETNIYDENQLYELTKKKYIRTRDIIKDILC